MGETDESGRDLDDPLTNVFNSTGFHRVRRKFGCWDFKRLKGNATGTTSISSTSTAIPL